MTQTIYDKVKIIIQDAFSDLIKDKVKLFFNAILTIVSFSILVACAKYIVMIGTYKVEIWKGLSILFLVYFARYIYKNKKSKMKHGFIKSGLKWDAIVKKNKVVSIKGPFCTNCEYAMSESDLSHDDILQCPKCNNKYNVNKGNTRHLKESVNKIIDSDLRLGKILMIDWYIHDYPYSHFKVTNKGTFSAENVKIDISLNIHNYVKHIGCYLINKIIPDETKTIDDSDPMEKINQIFNNLNLIEIMVEKFQDGYEDPYGNIEEFENERGWPMLKKDFSSILEIDINYSWRGKNKFDIVKYSLSFDYTYDPYDQNPYEQGNCKIALIRIE